MVQLASHLAQRQQSQPLPPLEAETVIVQSNDLSRWLSLFLAHQHGVASHIEFPYPSAYIWSLFRQLLPDVPQHSDYSTDAMSWRLFELLPECRKQAGFELIDAYLGPIDDPLKCYTFAHRIADTFDQYLMYRPDWIQAWEKGEQPHWQARLWQQLTGEVASPPHRANLLVQLQSVLSSMNSKPEGLPSRLAIFGVSALPPVYMDLFALLAEHCEVTLYLLSPSEEYWGDIWDKKSQARHLLDSAEDDNYVVNGHPLLASLGKQGQEFFEQLQDYPSQEQFLYAETESNTLLATLQNDIYTLHEREMEDEKRQIERNDDSIKVHSCHSAMREIEVLHDQLLDLFENHPELSPTDVVIMTPDIDLYTPWIEAVFSCMPAQQRLPYGIADSGIQRQSAIITTFNSLLVLPQSRFDVETIITLLECPAIQHRFLLDDDKLAIIRNWLRETHIHWGYSAKDKVSLDLPELETHTWRAGLDRLLLGFAMPLAHEREDWGLFDGKLGFDGISGDRADILAQLCRFIDQCDRYRQKLKGSFNAQQWQQTCVALLDDFFSTSTADDDADCLLLSKTIASLVEATELAKFDQEMSVDLLKEWIDDHCDSQQSQSRFMGQGLTFCGMVAMRSVPFPVVCLIGMNDASYPRRQPTAGFDLLSTHFRKGDRSRRDDDRYLFLESVLAAESHLYFSYIGASVADNALIPPSVLVSDLKDVLQQSFIGEEEDDIWQQVFTQHPLQAFSERYYQQKDNDDKLFSYVTANCPPLEKEAEAEPWFKEALIAVDESWRQVSMLQLIQFFSHPARYCLQHRLGLRFEFDEQKLESREPFALDGLQSWQLRQQLLSYRLQGKDNVEDLIKATAVMPQGQVGEQFYQLQEDKVDKFAETLAEHYPETLIDPIAVDLSIGLFSLTGQLRDVSVAGLFNYRVGKANGSQVMGCWIKHLILNCICPEGVDTDSSLFTEDKEYHFEKVAEAKQILNTLLELYWQGLHHPLAFFAKTSFAYAQATLNGGRANPDTAIYNAWHGNQMITGEGEDLVYQQLYLHPPLDEEFEQLALSVYEPLHAHLQGAKL